MAMLEVQSRPLQHSGGGMDRSSWITSPGLGESSTTSANRSAVSPISPGTPSPQIITPNTAMVDLDDEDFPPSISQRSPNINATPARHLKGERPEISPREYNLMRLQDLKDARELRSQRNAERTKLWAAQVARERREFGNDDDRDKAGAVKGVDKSDAGDNIDAESSTSCRRDSNTEDASKADNSNTSEDNPIRPVPILLRAGAKSPTAAPKTPVLSIDDIVRRHAAGVEGAMSAAKARARKELGSAAKKPPKPDPVAADPPKTPKSPTSISSGSTSTAVSTDMARRRKPRGSIDIPERTSSSPGAKVAFIPPRRSSQISLKSTILEQRAVERSVAEEYRATQALLYRLETGSIPDSPRSSTFTPRSPSIVRFNIPGEDGGELSEAEQGHFMAVHLRSPHLNRNTKFPRPYPLPPLNVSYAEVGPKDGHVVMVFLGLGCVRYLISIFEDLAKVFGLRMICIDRWGFGKTDMVEAMDRGVLEWTSVVGRVLQDLKIPEDQSISLLAHSAGAPYALAFAKRWPDRVHGRIHLLAPWVNTDVDGGYKWLKWLPNGVIKTATAADWKLQSYFLGKAPAIQHKPIGYTVESPRPTSPFVVNPSAPEADPRNLTPTKPGLAKRASMMILRPGASRASSSPSTVEHGSPGAGSAIGRSPRMKNIKSLAGFRSSSEQTVTSGSMDSIRTPSTSRIDGFPGGGSFTPVKVGMSGVVGLGITGRDISFGLGEGFETFSTDLHLALPPSPPKLAHAMVNSPSRISITSRRSSLAPLKRLASKDTTPSTGSPVPGTARGAEDKSTPKGSAWTLAIMQASHAECEPGTTADLLSIVLGRETKPWGFRPQDIASPMLIWWGAEDDKISRKGMEALTQTCYDAELIVVQDDGHNLMTNATVMCDVLQSIAKQARAQPEMANGSCTTTGLYTQCRHDGRV